MKQRGNCLLVALAILAGCATDRPYTDAEERAAATDLADGALETPDKLPTGRIALLTAKCEPASNFNQYARGKGAQAALTAGEFAGKGAMIGAVAPFGAAMKDPRGIILLPLAPLVLPFTIVGGVVVGGAVGAIKGAFQGMPGKDMDAIHAPIERMRKDEDLQERFASELALALADEPQYQFELRSRPCAQALDRDGLRAEGFVAAFDVQITSIGFDAWKVRRESPRAVFMIAIDARGVLLDGPPRQKSWGFSHQGPSRATAEWIADGERLMQSELALAGAELSLRVKEAALLPRTE